jgi:hypothetical protein
MNEQRLGVLLDRLTADLRDALPPELKPLLILYVAATELLFEEWQPADAGALRSAVARLALDSLGVTDCSVERAKMTLATGRDQTTLDRRQ